MGEPAEAIGFPQPFGKYTLLREIARGGMAEIFLAVQPGLQGFSKLIVIKRILPEYSRNKSFTDMLLDEARIAATFSHPNVIQVLDVGVEDGRYYIAMEYLAGENLRTVSRALRARNQGFPLEHSLSIVSDIAAGLHYAHTRDFGGKPLKIVHRDVSPKNVIVLYDGSSKIVDFGIAKATDKIFETRSGVLKGSLPYMSPEQARGESLDHRSDVFSLGTILYELTTGRRLFKEASDFHILKKIVTDRIEKPSEVVPGYPRDLEAIILHALARDRDDRYASSRALQEALDGFIRDHGMRAGPLYAAAFMHELFADKIAAQKEAERQGRIAATEPSATDGVDEDSGLELGPTGETKADPSIQRRKRRSARRARVFAIATLVVGISAAMTGAFLLARERLHAPPPGRSAVPVAVPLSPRVEVPQGAGVVAVRFETTPPGADVELYGRLLGRTPVELPIPRGDRPLQFVLHADGYRDAVREITPNEPGNVAAVLDPLPAAPAPSSGHHHRPRGTAPPGGVETPGPGGVGTPPPSIPQDDLVEPFRR